MIYAYARGVSHADSWPTKFLKLPRVGDILVSKAGNKARVSAVNFVYMEDDPSRVENESKIYLDLEPAR